MPSRQPLRGALRAALTAGRFGLFWSPCREGSICCTQQPVLIWTASPRTESRAVGERKSPAGRKVKTTRTRQAGRPEGLARERFGRHQQHPYPSQTRREGHRSALELFRYLSPPPKAFHPSSGPENGYWATCDADRPTTPHAAGQQPTKKIAPHVNFWFDTRHVTGY